MWKQVERDSVFVFLVCLWGSAAESKRASWCCVVTLHCTSRWETDRSPCIVSPAFTPPSHRCPLHKQLFFFFPPNMRQCLWITYVPSGFTFPAILYYVKLCLWIHQSSLLIPSLSSHLTRIHLFFSCCLKRDDGWVKKERKKNSNFPFPFFFLLLLKPRV